MSGNITFIYALIDPRDNLIHYIGRAEDPLRRYHDHLVTRNHWTQPTRTHKAMWIIELRNAGLRPRLQILSIIDARYGQVHETGFIKAMIQAGHPLTNSTHAGKQV